MLNNTLEESNNPGEDAPKLKWLVHNRALQEAKKEAVKKRKDKGIAHVAQLEDKMAIYEANIASAHPRSCQGI
jgi:hypothetical protein